MTRDQELRGLDRSIVLVLATSAAIFCIGFAVDGVGVRFHAPGSARALTAASMIVIPMATWITHWRWQSSRCSRVLLATATTLISSFFGWRLLATAGRPATAPVRRISVGIPRSASTRRRRRRAAS